VQRAAHCPGADDGAFFFNCSFDVGGRETGAAGSNGEGCGRGVLRLNTAQSLNN
jgi:hypothetical protein